jgi:release factor glutamine methyltransferase
VNERTLRELLEEAAHRLGVHADARWIVEEASGWVGADLVLHLDDAATAIIHARWSRLVERRAAGEPLQYVLGRWGFRGLDLLVDRRVLIPRPETEHVVSVALELLDAMDVGGDGASTVVDLGTGSGAIALSVGCERPRVNIWGTDRSADALEVARANLAGIGRAAARVRMLEGDWFDALPNELAGSIDLVVTNPPYVATGDALPDEVARWEPNDALLAGSTGLDAIAIIPRDAPHWVRAGGALVVEIGETQGEAATELAAAAGFTDVEVRSDLAGRPRVLCARC